MITTRESLILVTGNPWSKRRPKISRGGHRTHQDPADAAAEAETRRQLAEQWGTHIPWIDNIKLDVVFYRKNRQICDLDNLLKHLQDAGNGILWTDDCLITGYGRVDLMLDSECPRTAFSISRHISTLIRHKPVPPGHLVDRG